MVIFRRATEAVSRGRAPEQQQQALANERRRSYCQKGPQLHTYTCSPHALPASHCW